MRGDSKINENTRLLFLTTGVLLRMLQCEGALDCVTHICIDEVHERHLDTDVLLGLLKQSYQKHKHLRIILMSATLDADRFANYWGQGTPRVFIPGRTFPVADHMLGDVLTITGYIPPKKKNNAAKFSAQGSRVNSSASGDTDMGPDGDSESGGGGPTIPIEELVERVDETSVDYSLLGSLVRWLVQNKKDDGSILIFLSGAPEISQALETIKRMTRDLSVLLLPLHGGLQPKDQNSVFHPAAKGVTKVICSTNVAETSVTIPDCKFTVCVVIVFLFLCFILTPHACFPFQALL